MRVRQLMLVGVCVLCAALAVRRAVRAQWSRADAPRVKTYDLLGFSGVTNSLPGAVEVSQGAVFSVQGESMYDGLLDEISVEVRDGVLVIGASGAVRKKLSSLRRYPLFKLRVTMPQIEQLTLAGSGDVLVVTDVEVGALALTIAGSGELRTRRIRSADEVHVLLGGSGDAELGAVHGRALSVNLAGSGEVAIDDVNLQGEAELLVAGSGDLRIGDVRSSRMGINIAGSGSVQAKEVQVDREVKAWCNGSGEIALGTMRGSFLELGQSGSGDIAVASATVDKLNVQLLASGDIAVAGGSSRECEVSQRGSGDIDLLRHTSREADIVLLGSGDVKMTVTEVVYTNGGMPSSTLSIEGGARFVNRKSKGR